MGTIKELLKRYWKEEKIKQLQEQIEIINNKILILKDR